MSSLIKHYSNEELTIVWKPELCMHSRKCWQLPEGLPEVFHPATRPWITPDKASTEAIIEHVGKCPSGALSFFLKEQESEGTEQTITEVVAEVLPDGPLLVYGSIRVKHQDGSEVLKSKTTAFCRCGHSCNKPYCDGSHTKVGFKS